MVGSFELYDDGTQTFADTFSPSTSGHVFDNSTAARGEIQAIDDPGNNITILGTPVEGQTLTANTSTNDADATINYQWQESADGGDTWNSIEGATGSTYTLQQGDENNEVRVVATTSDPDNTQSATATSVATGPVQDAPPTVTVPVIEGTAQDGQTLTVSASAGGDDTLSYQWMENSGPNGIYQAIAAATGSTYVVQQGDEGYQIDVVATATNANGVTASETSASTAIVPPTTAADTFTEAAIGDPSNWFDPDNWSIEVPTVNDQVVISATFAQAALGAAMAGSLDVNSSATLDVSDGSLSVSGTLQNTATITVEGDADGVVASLYFGGDVTNNGSITLSGDAIPNAATANGESVTFEGSVTNTGSITLEAEVHGDRGAAPNVASALFVGTVTNIGTITVGAGTTTQVASATFESTVVNAGGQITVNSGAAVMLDSAIVEGGTIISTGSININGQVLFQDGIEISGGTLNISTSDIQAPTLDVETDPSNGPGNPADAVFDDINVNDDATIEVGTTTASGGTLMLKDGTEIFGHGTGALNIGVSGIVQIATNNDGTGIAATFDDLNVTLQSSVNGSGTIQVGGTELPATLVLTDGTTISGGELSIGSSGKVDIAFSDNINPDATFNGDLVVFNQGMLEIDSDAALGLAGTLTLQGGGRVSMDLNSHIVEVSDTAATLDNVDNTLEGAGTIGNGNDLLTVSNSGTIDANFGGRTLTIDTADDSGNSTTLTNTGKLEAESNGELLVHSDVDDTGGSVVASGGFVDFELGVTGGGTGTATISGGGGIEYGWSSDVGTAFDGSGTLVLDHQNQSDASYALLSPYTIGTMTFSTASYIGTVSSFAAGDTIDVTDLAYATNETVTWTQQTTGVNASGTLTMDGGSQIASVTLAGVYTQTNFALAQDNGTGTDVIWNPTTVSATGVDSNGNATEGDAVTLSLNSQSLQNVTYTWIDGGVVQSDATDSYTPTDDNGHQLIALVSFTDPTSGATDTVTAVDGTVGVAPPTVTTPTISNDDQAGSGTVREGDVLTASATARGDDTLSYQWIENNGLGGAYQAIVGATASTYVVQEGDENYQIEVVATATNVDGVTASQTSTPTSTVIDDATLSVAVSTTDNSLGVQEGQTLAAVATITGDATDLAAPVTYQWQSSSDGGQTWTNVGGAISGNYFNGIASFLQLTEANEGQELRVQASFTDDTGQTVSATSTPTTTVGDVTPVITAPFSYAVDDLSLVRNGTEFYNDTFSEAPPASPLPLTLSTPIVYFTNGSTWSESGGKAILSSTGVAPTNTGTGNYEVYAILNTNTDPTNTTMGSRSVQSFTVSATFDLTAATPGTSYGVQLNDGTSTQVPDQIVSLYVHGQSDGSTVVELVQSDLATDPATSTVLASETLTAAQLEDNSQIELQLSHVANSTAINGIFELLNDGTGTPVTFTPTGTIFTDGVDYTRADLVALTGSGIGLNVGAGQAVQEGQTLTASATTNDADATVIFQWQEASSPTGTFTNIGLSAAGTENANGVWTSSYTVQPTGSGEYIRVVGTTSDPDNTQSATATSAVTGAVGPRAVAQTTSSLTAVPGTVTADGETTTTLTVTAKDAEGNPIGGATVALTSADTGDHFGTVSGTTNAQGVFTTTLSSTEANAADTVTALINGTASETASVDFTTGAVSQTTSSLTASPSTVAADGTSTTLLTVTAEDANGNVIPDATVTLTAAGTGNTFTTPITGTTNAEGVFTTTLSSTVAQNDTFTALINGTASETAAIDFTAALSVTASVIDNLAVQEGQTLVATATIADSAYSGATIGYQWQSSSDGGVTWTDVGGALAGNFNNGQPSSFLQLTEADEGLEFRVQASITNSANQVITATSAATTAVADVTPLITPAFSYTVDDLSIVKNGTQIYNDAFAQAPPASSTISNSGVATPIVFATLGSTWTEGTNNAGQAAAVLSSTGVAQNPVNATTDQVYALLATNTDPTNTTAGLKEGAAFTVSATFDLTPTPYGSYGLQLNNGTSTHTPDQVVNLFVQSGSNGSTIVSLIDSDPAAGTSTVLASQTLTTAELASSNEVEFQLSHAANTTAITGTFELLDNGTVTLGPTTFTPTGTMFANTDNWAQVAIGAFVSSGVGLNVGANEPVQVGQTLTVSATTNDADATINYQWEESSSSSFGSFTDIGGNSASYTVQNADLGDYIRVVATTSDPDNTLAATATSAVTGAVGLDHWIAGSGNWTTAADWSLAAPPTSAQMADLDAAGIYTVTSSGTVTVAELISNPTATLNITGGTFTVTNFEGQGPLVLSGGTLNIGSSSGSVVSLTESGGATLTGSGNVTVTGSLAWSSTGSTMSGSGVTIIASTATGTITGNVDLIRDLDIGGQVTVGQLNGGNSTIQMGSASVPGFVKVLTDGTLTLIGAVSGFGGDGILVAGGGFPVADPGTVENAGTIIQEQANSTSTIAVALTNDSGGVINAESGTLDLTGGGSSAGTMQAEVWRYASIWWRYFHIGSWLAV